MNQSEPVNPRMRLTERSAISFQGSTIAAEISGYADIGMKSKALALARKVLKKHRILPEEFGEAVRAMGMYLGSKTWNAWKPKIEAAYNRQSQPFKRKVRLEMLSMHASLEEWEAALQFVCIQKPFIADALFGIEVLLQLDKLEDAEILASRCWKALRHISDRFQRAVILTALGVFFTRTRRWSDATEVWEAMPLEQPFRRDALSGIVNIHLARAFEAAERGLQWVAELKNNPNNEGELMLPGNELALTAQAEKDLLKFKRGIEKLLPEKVRKELGIDAKSEITSNP